MHFKNYLCWQLMSCLGQFSRCGFTRSLGIESPPTLIGVGHQWTENTKIGRNQWLTLAKIATKVPHAGRNRSLVARTSRCGECMSSHCLAVEYVTLNVIKGVDEKPLISGVAGTLISHIVRLDDPWCHWEQLSHFHPLQFIDMFVPYGWERRGT